MQLVIGKSRYAQNLEQAAAQAVTTQLVKSVDNTVLLSKTTKQDKTAEIEVATKLSVEDAYYKEMNFGSEQTAAAKQVVDYLNSLSFKNSLRTNAGNMQSLLTLSDKAGAFLNVNMVMSADGKNYLQLPDISKKYFSAENTNPAQSIFNAVNNLKYDSTKLNASLSKILSAYSDAVGKAAVTAENDQTLTVDGVVVQGQKLTTSLNAEQTAAMVKSVIETAKKDEYLFTVISENYPAFISVLNQAEGESAEPGKLTRENYNSFFDGLASQILADRPALSVSTYIARNGTLLARSYVIAEKAGTTQVQLLFPKNRFVVSVTTSEKSGMVYAHTTTGLGAGNIQIKVKSSEQPENMGITIDYSGFQVGSVLSKCKISLYHPDDTLAKSFPTESQVFKKLGSSTMTMESALDSTGKLTASYDLSLPGLATLKINMKMAPKTGKEAIAIPTDAGQIIDMSNPDAQQEQKQYITDSLKYVSGLMDTHNDLAAVLKNFGITKEMISMYLEFSAS
jgi:hypothetical protein